MATGLEMASVLESASSPALHLDSYPEEPAVGTILGGRYRLESVIGRGGMGVVYKASHLLSRRLVAVKWLLVDDVDTRERFLREARALGTLSHPNVVSILDVAFHEGREFLVMEYLEGKTLRRYARERGSIITLDSAIELLLPVVSGLAAAHRAGFVHRDVKPGNIFVCLDRDGSVYDIKLLDFGVVRRVTRAPDDYVTVCGSSVGTPKYMAPEQLRADPDVDPRADVYAFGVVLHELISGKPPNTNLSEHRADAANKSGEIETSRALTSAIPSEAAPVFDRMLSWDREGRYRDATALGYALAELVPGARFDPPREIQVSASSSSEYVVADHDLAPKSSPDDVARAEAPTPAPRRRAAPSNPELALAIAPKAAARASRTNRPLMIAASCVVALVALYSFVHGPFRSSDRVGRPSVEAAPVPFTDSPRTQVAFHEPEPSAQAQPLGSTSDAVPPAVVSPPPSTAASVEPPPASARRRTLEVRGRSGTLRSDEF